MIKSLTHWWLAEVSPYGYASTLVDGPHDDRAGVEKAAFLYKAMDLQPQGKQFCCVQVIQTPVEITAQAGIDKDAIEIVRRGVTLARSRGRL